MATRFIDKEYGADTSTAIANDTTGTRKVQDLPDAVGFVWDKVAGNFKFNASGTIKTLADLTSTQTFTNKTLTSPTITGATLTATSATLTTPTITNPTISGTTPLSVTGSSATLGATHVGRWTVADRAAGVAFTLPAATGTGDEYKVVIGTVLTSGVVSVTCAGSDKLYGIAIVEDAGDTTATDATVFATVNGTTTIWTSAFTGGGGEIGDYVHLVDFATAKWLVKLGWGQKVLDSTASPFS